MNFSGGKIQVAFLAFMALLLNPVGAYSQDFVKRSLISGFSAERWHEFGAFYFNETSEYQKGLSLPLLVELAEMGIPEANFALAQFYSYPFLTDFSLNTDHQKRNAYLEEAAKKGSNSAKESLIYSDLKVLLAMTRTFPECGAHTANSYLDLHNRLIELINSDDLQRAVDDLCVVNDLRLAEDTPSLKALSKALYSTAYKLFELRNNSQNARDNLAVSFFIAAFIDFIATASSSEIFGEDIEARIGTAFAENCSKAWLNALDNLSPTSILSVLDEIKINPEDTCIVKIFRSDKYFSVFEEDWIDVLLFLSQYIFISAENSDDMLPTLFQWWHDVLAKSVECIDNKLDFDFDASLGFEYKYSCGDEEGISVVVSRADLFPDENAVHVSIFDNLLYLLFFQLSLFVFDINEDQMASLAFVSGLEINEDNIEKISPLLPVGLFSIYPLAYFPMGTNWELNLDAVLELGSVRSNESVGIAYTLARSMYIYTSLYIVFGPLLWVNE